MRIHQLRRNFASQWPAIRKVIRRVGITLQRLQANSHCELPCELPYGANDLALDHATHLASYLCKWPCDWAQDLPSKWPCERPRDGHRAIRTSDPCESPSETPGNQPCKRCKVIRQARCTQEHEWRLHTGFFWQLKNHRSAALRCARCCSPFRKTRSLEGPNNQSQDHVHGYSHGATHPANCPTRGNWQGATHPANCLFMGIRMAIRKVRRS